MFGLPDWLSKIVKPLPGEFGRLILYSLFINILALATPVFVLQVYDRVVFQSGLNTLKALIIGVFIALIFDFILRQSRSRLLQYISLNIDGKLGGEIFDRFTSLPLSTLEKRPSSYWQAVFRDIEHIRNFFGGATIVLFIDIPFAVIFVGLIYLIAPPLIWVFLITIIIFGLLAWHSSNTVKKAAKKEQGIRAGVEKFIIELVNKRSTIKSLNLGEKLRSQWSDKHSKSIESSLGRGRLSDGYANINIILTMLVTVALTSFGALAILGQEMTIGSLIAANMLATRVIQPLSQLTIAWRSFNQFKESRDRIGHLIAESEQPKGYQIKFERPGGHILVDHVSFAYSEDQPVLKNVSMVFEPGKVHAVIGSNGSGKSTLLKLIQNLYPPDMGKILWDQADVRQFQQGQLASWLGYVSQECTLFDGTIRDNIAGFSAEVSDDEVIKISKELGLHSDISDLPDGYNTVLGEGGHVLSVGQRQKIVTVRAMIGKPSILLLDEPTSNLDQASEILLKDAISERAKIDNATVILITHSPTLLSSTDQIIVLREGQISMAGPKDAILPKLMRPPTVGGV